MFNINKINKKADSKLLFLYMLSMLTLIGVIISIGVWAYFSSVTDVRLAQANAMNNRIVFAVSSGGYIRPEVFMDEFRMTSAAGISDELLRNSKEFYFNVTIFNETGSKVRSFVLGNPDFEFQCRLPGKNYPKCKDSTMVLVYSNFPDLNEKFIVRILTGVNQKNE
ncbi:hypothetical protein GOV12_04305 [Candidatus Pacearchaeota archaeon]|nr:hypothetical protein [Candidatus Pacearchaeota archaeon]